MRLHSGWDYSFPINLYMSGCERLVVFGIMWDFIGLSNLKSIWVVYTADAALLMCAIVAERRKCYHKVSFCCGFC